MKVFTKGFKEAFLLFIISSAATVILTFPWLAKFDSSTYCFGHSYNIIYRFWYEDFARLNYLSPERNNLLSYPGGAAITNVLDPPVLLKMGSLLTRLSGHEVFSYNLLLFLTFPLTFMAVYYLLKFFSQNILVSLFLAGVFTFSPYRLQHLCQLTLAATQFFPLAILFFFRTLKSGTLFNLIFFGIFLTLTSFSDWYYGYFLYLFLVLYIFLELVKKLIFRKISKELLKMWLRVLLVLSVVGLLIFLSYKFSTQVSLGNKYQFITKTTTDDLIYNSARPWNYIIPSVSNPILGKTVLSLKKWLAGNKTNYWFYLPQSLEAELFLGYTSLFLASAFFYQWARGRWKLENFTNLLFILIFFFLLSLPPDVYLGQGNQIHKVLLSFRFHEYLPMFRSYLRLGIFVHLIILIFAATALTKIISVRSRRASLLIFTFFLVLSSVEYLRWPSLGLNIFDKIPDVYEYVKKLPKNSVIADFPEAHFWGNCERCNFYQRYHQKPLYGPGKVYYFDTEMTIEDTSPFMINDKSILSGRVFQKMKNAGVNYVVVHNNWVGALGNSNNLGNDFQASLHLEKIFSEMSVFKVL